MREAPTAAGSRIEHILIAVSSLALAADGVALAISGPGWPAVLGMGVVAAACGGLAAIASSRLAAGLSLLALTAGWAGTVHLLQLGHWSGAALLPLSWLVPALGSRGTRWGRLRSVYRPWAVPGALVWSGLVVVITLAQPLTSPDGWPVATAFGGLALMVACFELLTGMGRLLPASPVCLTIAVLGINRALGLGQTSVAVELVALAALYLGAAEWLSPARSVLRASAAAHMVLCTVLVAQMEAIQALALLAATGLGLVLTVRSRHPYWIVLPAATICAAYYWLARAYLPLPVHPSPVTLATLYAPVPAAFALVACILREVAGRRWAVPVYSVAALLGLAVLVVALRSDAPALGGRTLLMYAGSLYLIAVVERMAPVAAAALGVGLAGTITLLHAGAVPSILYPVACTAVAAIVYAGVPAWRRWRAWRRLHLGAGMAVATLAVLWCAVSPGFWSGLPGTAVAIASLAGLVALLAVEARLSRRRSFLYLALLAGALAGPGLAKAAGAGNPLWYLAVPALTFTMLAVYAPHDRSFPRHPTVYCRLCVGFGSALLLGTTAVLSFSQPVLAVVTGLLLVEGATGLLVGALVRNRVLALSGGAGLSVFLIRVITLLAQTAPTLAMVAVAALLLLLCAAAAPPLRTGRIEEAMASLGRTWQQWT